jgi:hypothetical protein
LPNTIANFFTDRANAAVQNLRIAQEHLRQIHSRNVNADLYKMYLPMRTDTIVVSEAALREAMYDKIQGMIDRGESLKSIPYAVFEQFMGDRFYLGWETMKREYKDWDVKFEYERLSFDGKSKQEMEKFVLEVVEKWRKGEDVTEYEEKWMNWMVNGRLRDEYHFERQAAITSREFEKELERNGIVLGEGETLEITMTCFTGKYEISGIEDEATKQKIKEILESADDQGPLRPSQFYGVINLLSDKLDIPVFPPISYWSTGGREMSRNAVTPTAPYNPYYAHPNYMSSTITGIVERYLKNETNGSVLLKDLSLDSKGFIHGLPEPLSATLNNAKIYNPYIPLQDQGVNASAEERSIILGLSGIKKYILSTLEDMQRVGGYDNLPRLNMYFQFSNGGLKPVDKYS